MGVKLIRLLIENLNKKAKWRNGDQPEITTVSQLLDMLTHKVNNSSVLFFSKKGEPVSRAEKDKQEYETTDEIRLMINIKEEMRKQLQGLSLKNIKLTIIDEKGKVYFKEQGEMLFTHFGISGPLVLSASCYICDKFKEHDFYAYIDLKPALDKETLDKRILKDFNENINKNFNNSLDKLLPKKMIEPIIELCNIDPYKKVNEITKEEREILVENIKNIPLTISGTRGFNEAIITRGGISVKDINPKTMESKIVPNMYFVGEVLDLDAKTGGYNLQIAWSTGYLAGSSIY